MIPGAVIGWDMGAALALAAALGIAPLAAAELLPEIEAVMVRRLALARRPSGAEATEARGGCARQQVRAHRLAPDGVRRRLQSACRDADLI